MKKLLLCSLIIGLITAFHTTAYAAELSLNPASGVLTQECENTIDIIVNTQGADTRGADAFMTYNPNEIEILSIQPGNLFKSYPGKIIRNGDIFITAFSENGFFKGNGSLARLVFKSKPGVKSTTISFKHSPGSTVDSNVAGREANDMLTAVFSGTYTFGPGTCGQETVRPSASKKPLTPVPDIHPPHINNLRPGANWKNMVPNSDLTFDLIDDGSGIDLNSIVVELDNIIYTTYSDNKFEYNGNKHRYKIKVNPNLDFAKKEGEKILVSIKAKDFNGNQFSLNYDFEVYPTSICPNDAHPSAPEIVYSKGARNIIWILLIFLLIALITNVWLATELPVKEDKLAVKVKSNLKKQRIKENDNK